MKFIKTKLKLKTIMAYKRFVWYTSYCLGIQNKSEQTWFNLQTDELTDGKGKPIYSLSASRERLKYFPIVLLIYYDRWRLTRPATRLPRHNNKVASIRHETPSLHAILSHHFILLLFLIVILFVIMIHSELCIVFTRMGVCKRSNRISVT